MALKHIRKPDTCRINLTDISYDPESGLFFRFGKAIGHLDKSTGYMRYRIDGKFWLLHRLAWLMYYGEPIPRRIDHRDCNRSNNRIKNLRPATMSQNLVNRGARVDSVSGVKGVHANGRKWVARIKIKGRLRYLGSFDTIEQAKAAFDAVATELHGEFFHA